MTNLIKFFRNLFCTHNYKDNSADFREGLYDEFVIKSSCAKCGGEKSEIVKYL